ncbi:Asp/Glu/hydantoin racemase [Tepidanaerobacter acetatoxydans Re1]|uniref:Asp/Glu/hydantoin racemase n=1 Tax=Tepidanaerobacter acetatoxydans (strain DSM 21804 / JCM 16047 / Re1) TaxID=1209989 RepID=F4LQT6_TEPAE|nr:aspartate/glutamate racemase family protein [Tepidanaerobacter acetatoxydans]AEE92089.1 Asp/Glu/hydantoin racemase [Tepidanaerobacter acetatoxydans Re1]CCP26935.1 Asp/Glu/hydantoin racemase [Tepidanaerobacter acetatoxydans Re1]
MKVAVIYTSTTPELIEMINDQLKTQLSGKELIIQSYQDPSILQEVIDNGYPTHGCARRLMNMYEQAVKDGADILLNVCSSVGDIAKLAKPLYEMTGVKFVRMDEEMAMQAVCAGKRIGIIATLPTALEPTKRLVQDCADSLGRKIDIVDALAEGAFGLDQEQFKKMLIATGAKVKDKVDALVFAQGSMSYAEEDVSKALGVPVFSSIKYGIADVKKAADSLE